VRDSEWGALAIFDAEDECIAALSFRAPDGTPEEIDRIDAVLLASAPAMRELLVEIHDGLIDGASDAERVCAAIRSFLATIERAGTPEEKDG
jgi:hypothetical protein